MDSSLPGDEDRLAPDRHLTILPTDRRRLVAVTVAALLPLALLGIWARFDSPASWEPGFMAAIATRNDGLGTLTGALNALGNLPVWAIVIGAASVAVAFARGIIAALLVAASFASDLAAFAIKLVVERDRPETAANEQFFGVDSFSFPSGHTVRAAALVAILIWVVVPPGKRLRLAIIGGLVAGALMGYARVSLGVHWPTDAIGGTLLGVAWFALTAAVTVSSRRFNH
jgi:membrane-associated phospholipid phosphatase